MFDFLKIIFEKLSILYIAMIVFSVSASVIFLPDKLLDKLMLQSIRNQYGMYLGLAVLFSAAYIVVVIIGKIITTIDNWNYERKYKSFIIEKMGNFTDDDMYVLSIFFDHNTKAFRETAQLDYFDRRVKLLESYGIITRLASSGFTGYDRDYNITCPMPFKLNSFVRKFLHQQMLQGK